MALKRRLLAFGALASLALLVYGGVSLAFSVPVTEAIAEANSGPTGGIPADSRAIVVPVTDSSLVPTHANERDVFLGHAGAYLVWGEPGGFAPVQATNVSIGRALLRITGDMSAEANASTEPRLRNVTGVPMPHPDSGHETGNLTLNLSAVPSGESGFFVKPDHAENATWVADSQVVGHVVRFEPPTRAPATLGGAALGLVLSVVALFVTHKGAGRRGVDGVVAEEMGGAACRECRAPLAKGESFCTRCGAWKDSP